jgi:hypothetical protein
MSGEAEGPQFAVQKLTRRRGTLAMTQSEPSIGQSLQGQST